MANKKPIILIRKNGVKYASILADECGCSIRTVSKALKWENDTPDQRLVRQKAYELGIVNLAKSPRKLQSF